MLTPAPHVVFWELTARCNLRCRHCRAEAGKEPEGEELQMQQLLRIARDIRATGDPILILTGGEPLLRADFFELAEECCRLFSRVAVASNGTCIDNTTAQRLADCGIQRVSISLDGAEAGTHDSFRGQIGSYAAALEGCHALRRVGMSLQINTTLTRHNVTQLDSMIGSALALGADAFHLFVLVPVGCGAEIPVAERLTAQEVDDCLRALHRHAVQQDGTLQIKATCAPQYYRILHEQNGLQAPGPHASGGRGLHAATRGCLAGSGVCFVSRNGTVQPCGYLPIAAGNALTESFGNIWRESQLFQTLRDLSRLQGTCGRCRYNACCQGCRARAYAKTGDYMAQDPECILCADTATGARTAGAGM